MLLMSRPAQKANKLAKKREEKHSKMGPIGKAQGTNKQSSGTKQAALPTTCSARISSNDWIDEHKNEHEHASDLVLGSVFEDPENDHKKNLAVPLVDCHSIFTFLEHLDRLVPSAKHVGAGGKDVNKMGTEHTSSRISSADWINDYKSETLNDVPFQTMFDNENGGTGAEDLVPLDSLPCSQDAMFEFLIDIQRKANLLSGTKSSGQVVGPVPDTANHPAANDRADEPSRNDVDLATRSNPALEPEIAATPGSRPQSCASAGTGHDPTPQSEPAGYFSSDAPELGLWPAGSGGHVYCELTDLDVLCGRGGKSNHHPGNKRYRKEVDELKTWYRGSDKTEKTDLSQCLVNHVHSYGGRFLKKEAESGKWYVVENKVARRKASQALREREKAERLKSKKMGLDKGKAGDPKKEIKRRLKGMEEAGETPAVGSSGGAAVAVPKEAIKKSPIDKEKKGKPEEGPKRKLNEMREAEETAAKLPEDTTKKKIKREDVT